MKTQGNQTLGYFSEIQTQLKSESKLRFIQATESPQGRLIQIKNIQYLNFASNDYLGLANHPKLKTAMQNGVQKYGAGSGASRLINGSLQPFHDLEKQIADFKNTEAALVFNSGYMANVGVLSSLATTDAILFSDELNHASMVDGIRLSKAAKVIFRHLDINDLEHKIKHSPKRPIKIIATESVFSMDGDICPLKEILDLAEAYDCLVFLDEAHATGVFGPSGAGIAETHRHHPGYQTRLIQMGTLGKALGCFGAYVASPQIITNYLINHARTFIYATALPPSIAIAAQTAIELVEKDPEIRNRLWQNIDYFHEKLQQYLPHLKKPTKSPIIPIVIGDNQATLNLSQYLKEQGFWVTAIRPPTVPEGTARLRVTLSAKHQPQDIDQLLQALAKFKY